MTNINDLRKQHEENVRWNPYATRHTWDKADVDALFAEIDRLTNENAALRSEVQRHKDRVDEVWGKLDGETKASFAMRWIPEDLNLSVTRTSSHTIEVATPTPPPTDAPTASDKIDAHELAWLNMLSDGERHPVSPNDHYLLAMYRKLFRSGYVTGTTAMRGTIANGDAVQYWARITDEGRKVLSPIVPLPAAPTPAAAAAQAALRGHTFEKPKAAELTRPQRRALTMATTSKTQWVYRGTSWNNDTGEIPRGIFDTLMKMKLLQLFVPGETFFQRAVLSDAGLDALRGAK